MVREEKAEKYNKGFTAWMHLRSMIFAQLTGQHGLRSIEASFSQNAGAMYHLGVGKEIKRSTLSTQTITDPPNFLKKYFTYFYQKWKAKDIMVFRSKIHSIQLTQQLLICV